MTICQRPSLALRPPLSLRMLELRGTLDLAARQLAVLMGHSEGVDRGLYSDLLLARAGVMDVEIRLREAAEHHGGPFAC